MAALVVLAFGAGLVWPRSAAAAEPLGARLREAARAAEGLQGPLDGGWTLVSRGGARLYDFQIAQPSSSAPARGAWRDLRRPSVAGDIGVIDTLEDRACRLDISFVPALGEAPVAISLRCAKGLWSGEMRAAAEVTNVELRRAPAAAGQ